MIFKSILKAIGVAFLIFAAGGMLGGFAMLVGKTFGKTAKASSVSAKIKLEQNVQPSTQSIDDQLRRASQQNEADQAVSNITYFSDPRTGICFAYLEVYDSYGASRSITTVNCGLVPKDLLITAKK